MDRAKTGMGLSVTPGFIPYINQKDPNDYIKLIDSKGIESQNDINTIIDYIKEKLKQKNRDEFIHCIWYCCTSYRFGPQNYEEIKKLLNTYEDDYLPIIIVKTISDYEEEDDEFLKKLKIYLKDFQNIEYVKVLAKKRNVEPFGLEGLKEITLSKLGKAVNSSFYQSIKEIIKSSYIELIKMNLFTAYGIVVILIDFQIKITKKLKNY